MYSRESSYQCYSFQGTTSIDYKSDYSSKGRDCFKVLSIYSSPSVLKDIYMLISYPK